MLHYETWWQGSKCLRDWWSWKEKNMTKMQFKDKYTSFDEKEWWNYELFYLLMANRPLIWPAGQENRSKPQKSYNNEPPLYKKTGNKDIQRIMTPDEFTTPESLINKNIIEETQIKRQKRKTFTPRDCPLEPSGDSKTIQTKKKKKNTDNHT